ncbi:malate dehydrogenase, partial [bacterium]|nr:malate dehydrogenase [bacterium]
NNLLGFPAIFRGALDFRACQITEKMKMAATQALIKVTKMPVLPEVHKVYGLDSLEYGRNYIIPKPFDPRVLVEVAFAVASTAVEEGVNRIDLDLEKYRKDLEARFLSK